MNRGRKLFKQLPQSSPIATATSQIDLKQYHAGSGMGNLQLIMLQLIANPTNGSRERDIVNIRNRNFENNCFGCNCFKCVRIWNTLFYLQLHCSVIDKIYLFIVALWSEWKLIVVQMLRVVNYKSWTWEQETSLDLKFQTVRKKLKLV